MHGSRAGARRAAARRAGEGARERSPSPLITTGESRAARVSCVRSQTKVRESVEAHIHQQHAHCLGVFRGLWTGVGSGKWGGRSVNCRISCQRSQAVVWVCTRPSVCPTRISCVPVRVCVGMNGIKSGGEVWE